MSSGSESDEDFVPGEPEKVSEEESADDETENQYESELAHKASKRKAVINKKGIKIRRTRNGVKEIKDDDVDDECEVPEKTIDPVEEKKKEDDLWAKFLEGTETTPKPAPKESNVASGSEATKSANNDELKTIHVKKSNIDEDRERRIFEFAGETIVVEKNTIKEKIKASESPGTASIPDGPSRAPSSAGGAGLSSVLGHLNKKNKLSTLEKSKLDWVTYKKDEGIEEEIQSHNKGKKGFLDRRDFLERADMRQYEIERDLRINRRSNR